MSQFDPAKDVKMTLETNLILPRAMRELHTSGNLAEFNRLKSAEKADLDKLAHELHLHPEEHAWTDIQLKDGSSMKVFFQHGVGTLYSRVVPHETSHTATSPSPTGRNGATAQLGMYSATTKSGTLVTWKFDGLSDTMGWQAFHGALSHTAAGIAFKLTRAGAGWGLGKAAVWLSDLLFTHGLIDGSAQLWMADAAADSLAIWSSRYLCIALGGLLGVGIGLAVTGLVKYATADYYLTMAVYNFDAQHEWKVVEQAGRNVQVLDGVFPGVIKPMEKSRGVLPPGFLEEPSAMNMIVNYRTYYFKNDLSLAGFTVACLVRSGDIGFDFAYRVEKANDNSMHVRGGSDSAANYLDSVNSTFSVVSGSGSDMLHKNELALEHPVRVKLYSPELFHAPKDDYELSVYVGMELGLQVSSAASEKEF